MTPSRPSAGRKHGATSGRKGRASARPKAGAPKKKKSTPKPQAKSRPVSKPNSKRKTNPKTNPKTKPKAKRRVSQKAMAKASARPKPAAKSRSSPGNGARSKPGTRTLPGAPAPAPAPAEILPIDILPQPTDETCGPTCLHAVYRYWGDPITLDEVIASANSLNHEGVGRGTLAAMLGVHAAARGYKATLYTFNLHHFDPTWFDDEGDAPRELLIAKLTAQYEAKHFPPYLFKVATDCYIDFLRLGGDIRFRELNARLISGFIRSGRPVLTGLSSTYLYRCAREFGPNDDDDDIRGSPCGHFVIAHGYQKKGQRVTIADPLADNPGFESQRYTVRMSRLVPAIMLGVLTYDANLLVIEPADAERNI